MDIEEQQELRKKHRRARKMMLLFSLLSITMTFAGLTSAYIVSKSRPDWLVDFQLPNYFLSSTLIIVLSSIGMWFAKKNIKSDEFKKTSFWIGITFLLSVLFVISQFLGFQELISIENEATGKLFFSGFSNVINAMRKCPKIIIGCIHGKAVGGGVGIAAATDYCLATKFASIKLSELTIGIGPFVVVPAIERKIGVSALSQLTLDALSNFRRKILRTTSPTGVIYLYNTGQPTYNINDFGSGASNFINYKYK